MDGYYNNNSIFNCSGYSQRPSNNNFGSCTNCPGGICPRNMDHGQGKAQSHGLGLAQGQGQSMSCQRGCPGGNCCLGGNCSIRQSGSNQFNWPN
ncbi:hypothetical protein KR038_002441 [Drosophila bunnanda]|nr:hypothetical protein KR038_002441 [Drosophila bunnanda]